MTLETASDASNPILLHSNEQSLSLLPSRELIFCNQWKGILPTPWASIFFNNTSLFAFWDLTLSTGLCARDHLKYEFLACGAHVLKLAYSVRGYASVKLSLQHVTTPINTLPETNRSPLENDSFPFGKANVQSFFSLSLKECRRYVFDLDYVPDLIEFDPEMWNSETWKYHSNRHKKQTTWKYLHFLNGFHGKCR